MIINKIIPSIIENEMSVWQTLKNTEILAPQNSLGVGVNNPSNTFGRPCFGAYLKILRCLKDGGKIKFIKQKLLLTNNFRILVYVLVDA